MTNKKVTRRALLMSVTSLLICISMLLGTTFAWFTDEVTSGVNKIVAGNLDVELEHQNAKQTTSKKVDVNEKLFNVNIDGNEILWEPGAISFETLTVKNVGTLALKYQLNINDYNHNTVNRDGEEKSLLDVLKVHVTDTAFSGDRAAAKALFTATDLTLGAYIATPDENHILAQGADQVKTMFIYWPDDNTNDFDNFFNLKNELHDHDALFVDLGIVLVAGQYEHEVDSFDKHYDATAEYPVITSATSATETYSKDSATTLTALTAPNTATNAPMTSVVVPEGITDNDTKTMAIEVKTENGTIKISESNGAGEVASIDVKLLINGAETTTANNTLPDGKYYTVNTTITAGLTDVAISYGTETWTNVGDNAITAANQFKYNATTGALTFTTTHFSEFVVNASSVAYVVEQDHAYSTLQGAIEAATAGNTVALLKNVEIDSTISVTKPLTLEGNGKKVTNTLTKAESGKNMVVITTADLCLKNISLINEQTQTGSKNGNSIYPIGIAVDAADVNLTIDNSTVSANWYAVNGYLTAENLNVTINNGTVSAGWAALNLWGANGKVVASDSTFSGNNNKTYNADGWNNFSTLVINSTAENMAFSFENCTINAMQSTGNRQTVLSLRSNGANVKFENCTITYQESEQFPCAFYDESGYSNTLKVVGSSLNGDALAVDQTSPAPNVWYSNGSFTNPPDEAINTFFPSPFESGWMANGEGIRLLSDVEISNNVTCKMSSGTIYVYFDGHNVSGGKLILQGTTSVISDKGDMSEVFGGGTITVVDNNNGTYTYSLSADPT